MTAPDRYDRRDDELEPDYDEAWEPFEWLGQDEADDRHPADWGRWGLRAVRDLDVREGLL